MELKTNLITKIKFSLMDLTANLYCSDIVDLKTGHKDLIITKYIVKDLSHKNGIVYVRQLSIGLTKGEAGRKI